VKRPATDGTVPPAHLSATAESLVTLAELSAGKTNGSLCALLRDPAVLLTYFETEAQRLRTVLDERRSEEERRLRDLKLRALAELAAGAAHEINTPLAIISGHAQTLLKGEENLERAKMLERIIGQCQRVHDLLRDLLLYARPPKPRLRNTSLVKILDRAIRSLDRLAQERQVRVEFHRPRSKLQVRVDEALIETALAALIRNGIEAAPAGGWVRIGIASRNAQQLHICVEDSGPGVTLQRQEHLFDPFYSGRTAGRGAGLGLCRAWRVAETHGGTLELVSQPGEPTRFVLSLPIPRRQSARPATRVRRGK
jgi:signal transduction histidine kinase